MNQVKRTAFARALCPFWLAFRRLASDKTLTQTAVSDASPLTTYLAFVHVGPGLEPVLADELRELGFARLRVLAGGVELRVTLTELELICRRSLCAEGVRVRLKAFDARTFPELERGIEKLPLGAYFRAKANPRIDVVCHKSRLWHSDAVAERVRNALSRRLGAPDSEPKEADRADEPRLFVRMENDRVTVSVDASGERLHRRGYRAHVAEASLRETLAAAMLRALLPQPSGRIVIWDPFCGAGTLLLEAILRAEISRSDLGRRFSFQEWPSVASALESSRTDALVQEAHPHVVCAIGSDIDPQAISAARANFASLLGKQTSPIESTLEFHVGDVADVARQIPRGALVLTNPPYGHRLDEGQAIRSLLRVLRERPDLRPVGALVGGVAKRMLPGSFQVLFQTKNGGLPVALRVLGPPQT